MKCESILLLCTVLIRGTGSHSKRYFGYCAAEQVLWYKDFRDCHGSQQSPIEISTKKVTWKNMAPLRFKGYDRKLPPLVISNDGTSVEVSIDMTSRHSKTSLPTISGAHLKGEYRFLNFHYHWGRSDVYGSEHIIDGDPGALELHIVHMNTKYTKSEAFLYPDGFAVLGILFKLRPRGGRELNPILNHIKDVLEYKSNITISRTFALSEILGSLKIARWFQYEGSLTTPPCSEVVSWFIFEDRLTCSSKQIEQFRQLETVNKFGKTIQLYENNRSIQPPFYRPVYYNWRKW